MSNVQTEIVQAILHEYLERLKEEKEEGKRILKSLAHANARLVIGCLIDYLASLEVDAKYIELLTLLAYTLAHITETNFLILKPKLHEFLEGQINSSQQPKRTTEREQTMLLIERNKLILSLAETFLKFNDQDTVRLILNLFSPGKLPDAIALDLIRILVEQQGTLIRPYANELLTKFLSTCTLVESAKGRIAFARVIQSIYESLEIIAENDQITIHSNQSNSSQQQEQTLSDLKSLRDLTLSIYSMISSDWASHDDPECQSTSVQLIGYMVRFFPPQKLEKTAEKIIDTFVVQLKRRSGPERGGLCIGFTKVLESLQRNHKAYFEHTAKSVLVQLYDLYKQPIFSPNFEFSPETQKAKNALLSVLQNLAEFNPDATLDLYICRLSSRDTIERIACLWITHFLIVRFYQRISESSKKSIIASIQELVSDTNIEVRFALMEVMLSLWSQKKFTSDAKMLSSDISFMLFFLMQKVSIHPQEIAEKRNQRQFPFETTLEDLKARAQLVLQILTVSSSEDNSSDIPNPLWPSILQFIPNTSFSPGLPYILKAIHTFIVNYTNNNSSSIPNLSPSSQCEEQSDEKKFCDKIYCLWELLLRQFHKKEWFTSMHEDFLAVYSAYKKVPQLQCHMMKLHGLLLTRINNQETVKSQIDRFVGQVHTDYANHTVNLNNDRQEFSLALRESLADTLALIATEKCDLVVDKIRSIVNSAVIQKKQQSGFASNILGMLKKTSSDEESLSPIIASLVLALGHICIRLSTKQLALKIDSHVINNLLPFLDKQSEEIQISIQNCIEMVSRGALRIQGDCEESEVNELKRVFARYKEKFYQRSVIAFKTSRVPQIRCVAWQAATHLLKLDPVYSFEQHLHLFRYCVVFLNEEKQENLVYFDQPLKQLFEAMLHHVKLEATSDSEEPQRKDSVKRSQYGDENGQVGVWEMLAVLVKIIEQQSDIEVLKHYYNCLLRSLFDKKLPPSTSTDNKHITAILVVFLSHIYKQNKELQQVALFTLEKILIGMGVFLNVSSLNREELNEDLIKQLQSKLPFNEMQNLVNESIDRVSHEEDTEVLSGFTSLHACLYSHHSSQLTDTLDQVIKSYAKVFAMQEKLDCSESSREQLVGYVHCVLEKHLQQSLDVLLEMKLTFPLSEFMQRVLKRLLVNKSILFRTFNYLTDVLNNPEDKLFRCKGDAMTNSIYFIGYLFSLSSEILSTITRKYFPSIFGTFLLRFATAFDYDLNKSTNYKGEGMDASKVCLWAFRSMLENSVKNGFLDDISSSLQMKLMHESEFDDGVSELLMIASKRSRFSEIHELMEFLKPFLLKKLRGHRRTSLVVTSELIHSSSLASDFKELRLASQEIIDSLAEWFTYLIDELLSKTTDNDEEIRAIAFRGIGNITYLHKLNIARVELENDTITSEERSSRLQKQEGHSFKVGEHTNKQQQHQQQQQILDESIAENLAEILEEEAAAALNSDLPTITQSVLTLSAQRSNQIISVLFTGIEDSADRCVKEALLSLQKLIGFLPDSFIQPYVLSMMQKVTESFEKQDMSIRVSAFSLFGKLFEKVSACEDAATYLEEQLHYIIIAILVHLQDDSKQVQEACKQNFSLIAQILKMEALRASLMEESNENNFNLDLLNSREKLSLSIAQHFLSFFPAKRFVYIETLTEYTKSPEDTIKCSAILLLFLTLREANFLGDVQLHKHLLETVKQRILEVIADHSSSAIKKKAKLSNVDWYILKSSILLVESLNLS